MVPRTELDRLPSGCTKQVGAANGRKVKVAETLSYPEWLPHGWVIELKTRKTGSSSGTHYKCYVEPMTGSKFYSKPEVCRYLQTLSCNSGTEKSKIDMGSCDRDCFSGGKSSSKQEVSEDSKTLSGKNCTSKAKKSSGKHSISMVVVKGGSPDDILPESFKGIKTRRSVRGIKKDPNDIDCLIGDNSSLKPDISQDFQAKNDVGCSSERKTSNSGKRSTNNVVVERAHDELPPGWIKEIKTRKFAHGIKKDPYFTDPVSGYVFRSKKDVLRYLETGDINRCAVKPKKRDDLKFVIDEIAPPPSVDGKSHCSTRREHFVDGRNCETSKLMAPENETSMKRQDTSVSGSAAINLGVTTGIFDEKAALHNANGNCANTEEIFDLNSISPFHTKTVSIFTPTNILRVQNLSGSCVEKHSTKTIQVGTNKSKKKGLPSEPRRSSKGLAGLRPNVSSDATVNLGPAKGILEEKASLNNVIGKCVNTEEILDLNSVGPFSTEIASVSTPSTDILQVKNITGKCVEKHSNKITQVGSNKCKNKWLLSEPRRSSKRLAGLRPSVSGDATVNLAPSVGILEEKVTLNNVNGKCANTEENLDLNSIGPFSTEIAPVSTPSTDRLQVQTLPGNCVEKHRTKTTQVGSNKFKKKRVFSEPSRSSKRLAGLGTEVLVHLDFERALRAAAGKPTSAASHQMPQQLESRREKEIVQHASIIEEAPSNMEHPSKNEKHLDDQPDAMELHRITGDTAALGMPQLPVAMPKESVNHALREEAGPSNSSKNEKPQGHEDTHELREDRPETGKPEMQDSQMFCPFADSWSDPCLEFAVKTLTGAIPVEDSLAIQDYFRYFDSSRTQGDSCSGLPEFGQPNTFQNDVSSLFDAAQQQPQPQPQQQPVNSTFMPPVNVSWSNCSGIGPQQQNLKDLNK